MNQLLQELIELHAGRFRVAFSISGTALDQMESYAPEVLESFQALADTGCVEMLAETEYHSLGFVFDREEFDHQVSSHVARIERTFGLRPTVFRNTELIFNNELAHHLQGRFSAVIAEGVDRVLDWRTPNCLYTAASAPDIKLLLKNYKLSDDIAFRFGNRAWEEYPLTADRYARWIEAINGSGEVVNLFMDYETFGEHQWSDTGIFEFMRELPTALLKHPDHHFKTPSEVATAHETRGELDIHDFVSWADTERDLTAWLGNDMQKVAAKALYDLRQPILESGDPAAILAWRRLSTSDHLYYMCTKWFSDGDVHKYFSPYESPYEAYIAFMNVLNDLALRVNEVSTSRTLPMEAPALSCQPALM